MNSQLLENFFNGQCTEQEQQRVLVWWRSGKADKVLADQIEAHWKEKITTGQNWGKSKLLKSINEKIDEAESDPGKAGEGTSHFSKWWYAAAAVIFLSVSAAGWWWSIGADQPNEIVSNSVLSAPDFIYKKAERGEKRTITLRDGTVVKLNADSRIWYSPTFGELGKREVSLVGEAFFEVARDTLHPFNVRTGEVTTTVLGTSFNVEAYDPNQVVKVAVVTGKVEVQQIEKSQTPIYLQSNEQIEYSIQENTKVKGQFDHEEVLSWKEGILYFKNDSFSEVIEKLERWYGVDIDVKKQQIEDGFSGSYSNRSLKSVLEGIGFVLHFEHEIRGDRVTIK